MGFLPLNPSLPHSVVSHNLGTWLKVGRAQLEIELALEHENPYINALLLQKKKKKSKALIKKINFSEQKTL